MNKKINSVPSAETNEEVSANVQVTTSSPNNAKPNVARSFCLSFPIKILTHNIDISKLNSQKFIDFYERENNSTKSSLSE